MKQIQFLEKFLNFVVVGGGFAGIETAGELMDLLLDARKYIILQFTKKILKL